MSADTAPAVLLGVTAADPWVWGGDNTFRIIKWHNTNGSVMQMLLGHTGKVWVLRTFGGLVYSGGEGVEVRSWAPENGSAVLTYNFPFAMLYRAMALSGD